ncbi:hypothetical protein ON010_g5331 [Phytophthora cinnamomi]|nr:hypothetical protein ON010_g5331 [Phytophthora cinnamomi]
MAAVMDQRDIGQNTIKEAFGILDGEKQGRLSIVGLQDVFKHSMMAEEVKEMIASVDSKGDGYVDFEAFKGLFAVPGSPLPKLIEEDTSSDSAAHADSPEKPAMMSQSFCTTTTESTVDSTADRSTPSSTPGSTSNGNLEEPGTIKAKLISENEVTISVVQA